MKSISKNFIFGCLAIWTVAYIAGILISSTLDSQFGGYFGVSTARSLVWILLLVTQFFFVRNLKKTQSERFYLVSLYIAFAVWILFAAVGTRSIPLIVSIPLVFLSWQFYRESDPTSGKVFKQVKNMLTPGLLFSWSLVALLASLSSFWYSDTVTVILLFSMVFVAAVLAHLKADAVTSLVFSYASFMVGINNTGTSYSVATAGFSIGTILLINCLLALLISTEDPSKRVFAQVNPPKQEEVDLKIKLEKKTTRKRGNL